MKKKEKDVERIMTEGEIREVVLQKKMHTMLLNLHRGVFYTFAHAGIVCLLLIMVKSSLLRS